MKVKAIASLIALSTLTMSAQPSTVVPEIVLTKANHAELVSEVTSFSVNDVIVKLRSMDKSKPRYLFIDSPGGEVQTGLRLVNFLQSSEGKGVVCVANVAISMAFVSMQACETRIVTPNAVMMSHGISGGMRGYIQNIEAELALMKGLDYILAKVQAIRMGITVEQLRKLQNPEYWIVGSDDIIKANAADSVQRVTCGEDMLVPVVTKELQEDGKEIEVTKIACPL